MPKNPLPPIVSQIADGEITWQQLPDVDYDLIGYFLCCHLVIENHIDESLKAFHPRLNWDVRLTFAQKASLISTDFKVNGNDYYAAVKYLNSLRNKLSHDIRFKITAENLEPLKQYLRQAIGNRPDKVPEEPKAILEMFTTLVCALFSGGLGYHSYHRRGQQAKLVTP